MGAVFTVALFTVKLWLDIIVVNPIVPVVLIVQAVGLACYVRKNEAGGGGTILGFGWVLLTTAMFL